MDQSTILPANPNNHGEDMVVSSDTTLYEEPDAGKPHVRICEGPGRETARVYSTRVVIVTFLASAIVRSVLTGEDGDKPLSLQIAINDSPSNGMGRHGDLPPTINHH